MRRRPFNSQLDGGSHQLSRARNPLSLVALGSVCILDVSHLLIPSRRLRILPEPLFTIRLVKRNACAFARKRKIYTRREFLVDWMQGLSFCVAKGVIFSLRFFPLATLKKQKKRTKQRPDTSFSLMNVPDVQSDNNSCSQFQQHSTRCN